MVKSAGRVGSRAPSALRLYLFDNPILRLDMLLFRRRIAAMFTKNGLRKLALYVLIPAIVSFLISRWLFPPPYDKWSFAIFLETTGTMTLAIIAAIAVIYYLIDCAILAVNPLGLKARDALIDDPPVVQDYEAMLFYARVISGTRLMPLIAYAMIGLIFYDWAGFFTFCTSVGWTVAIVLIVISSSIAVMHLQAIFSLVFFYANSLFLRIIAASGVLAVTAAPFFVGFIKYSKRFDIFDSNSGNITITSMAWALHPFGTAVAFYNGIFVTLDDVYSIASLLVVMATIAFQVILVHLLWKLVRMRFKKMIRENYLQKAKRG